jgi:FkbH-like protein
MKTLHEIISLNPTQTISNYISLSRKIDQMYNKKEIVVDHEINIAILASSTVNGIKETLHVQCGELGIFGKFYIGEYNQYAQEILNSESRLYAFDSDLVIINIDARAISGDHFFNPYSMTNLERHLWVKETTDFLARLADEVTRKTSAKVLLHNLEVPIYTPLGLMESKEEYGFIESIEDVNRNLKNRFKKNNQVFVLDYDSFCSRVGKENVFDYKMYYMGDIKLKPKFIPSLCKEYTRYIQALTLDTKKCIVLDLDNTLWGGVIGESGIESIHLGPTPEGRPFLEFQRYLLSLSLRGVILAINSKNNSNDALEVIRNHPHMILKEENFCAMRINWDDKVSNMQSIAEEINIGLDSFVFFDDDRINRDMVEKFLPEVAVVDMPKDPSLYVQQLINLNYFNTLSFTEEDRKKSKMYVEQKERQQLVQSATDLTEYLRMLNITVYFEDANKHIIPRIAQLTQKTNQFNLTTRRYTEEVIKKFSESKNFRVISIKLIDKFGDNGLTGVTVIDKKDVESWRIDTFLLSCRILGRRAEEVLLAYIIEEAKKEGVKFIYGEFINSLKNAPAKNFYSNNGFIRVNNVNDLEIWEYDLTRKYTFPDFINYKIK